MKSTFTLDPDDVSCCWCGWRISARRKLHRASAAVDTQAMQLVLKHVPTGVEVQGEIPAGHYSNKHLQREKERLCAALHVQLRLAVAKHLRLPGR